MLKYYLFKIAHSIACALPLSFVYRVAVFLADIKYALSRTDRRAVRENLQVICGERPDLDGVAREVFRNFAKYLVDFFRMPRFTRSFLETHVEFENLHYLQEALSRKQGVIIMTAHIGNWELGGLTLGRMGYPLTAVALPHKEPALDEFFNRQRAEGGVTVVSVRHAIRRCLRALRENKIVALLADRDFSATGEVMPMFGRATMVPRGLAMFAYRTGAVILPMFLRRKAGSLVGYTLTIDAPLEYPENFRQMDEPRFIREMMRRQVAVLEEYIRRDPSQWLIFRRFWVDQETGPERIAST